MNPVQARSLQVFNELIKKSVLSSKFLQKSFCSASSNKLENVEFQMPQRIERAPTDILKALDSTVKRDKSGPHYRFHDDPFLTPTTNFEKRVFSLSKESGRKAANWIKDSSPHLFHNLSDEPLIPAFLPLDEYNEESQVSELLLQDLIERVNVKDAVTVYALCADKGIELDAGTVQSLLELLCYTNEEELESEEWYEERNLKKSFLPGRNLQNVWKTGGLADVLFEQFPAPGPPAAAHAALIRGLAKHNNVDDAWQRYEEAVTSAVPLDRATYNALICTAPLKHDGYQERWDIVTDLLHSMAKNSITPNLTTLNNSLQVLSLTTAFRNSRGYSLQLVKEMTLQDVTPSLATYAFLLIVHCRDRGPMSNILLYILEELEKVPDSIELRDSRDTVFFYIAMNTCRRHLRCLDTARRLFALFEKGQNCRLVGKNLTEINFYRTYLLLHLESLPMEDFMIAYNELVPHVYSPEMELMQEVIHAVAVQGTFNYLPTLWTDINAMGLDTDSIVTSLLGTMCQYVPDPSDVTFDAVSPPLTNSDTVMGNEFTATTVTLSQQVTRIINHLVNKIQELSANDKKRSKVDWTGKLAGEMLQVLSVCGGSEVGARLLSLVSSNHLLLVGEIPPQDLSKFSSKAQAEENPDAALLCALHCQTYEPDTATILAKQVAAMSNLTPEHRAKLAIMFGRDILKKDEKTEQ